MKLAMKQILLAAAFGIVFASGTDVYAQYSETCFSVQPSGVTDYQHAHGSLPFMMLVVAQTCSWNTANGCAPGDGVVVNGGTASCVPSAGDSGPSGAVILGTSIAMASDSPAGDGTDVLSNVGGSLVFTCYKGDMSIHNFDVGVSAIQGRTKYATFSSNSPAIYGTDNGTYSADSYTTPILSAAADCSQLSPGETLGVSFTINADPNNQQVIPVTITKATN